MLLTFLNILATIIGVISLLIVTYGVFVGFIAFLRNEFKRINGTYTINNVRQLSKGGDGCSYYLCPSFPDGKNRRLNYSPLLIFIWLTLILIINTPHVFAITN